MNHQIQLLKDPLDGDHWAAWAEQLLQAGRLEAAIRAYRIACNTPNHRSSDHVYPLPGFTSTATSVLAFVTRTAHGCLGLHG